MGVALATMASSRSERISRITHALRSGSVPKPAAVAAMATAGAIIALDLTRRAEG